MNHEYDLFEKFPDGSSLWRDAIPGIQKTQLRLQEMARKSDHQFYAVNLATGEIVSSRSAHNARELERASKTEERSKTPVA